MVVEEKLVEHFKLLNYTIHSKESLQKCIELCQLYELNEKEIADQYVSYALEVGDADLDISVQHMAIFKNWMGLRSNKMNDDAHVEPPRNEEPEQQSSLLASITSAKRQIDEDDVLEMYGYKKTPASNIVRQKSPGDASTLDEDKTATEDDNSSINIETSSKNSGQILLTFGDSVSDWKNSSTRDVEIRKAPHAYVLPYEPMGFNKPSCYGEIFKDRGRELAQVFYSSWPDGENHTLITSNVKEPSQVDFRTWGYIRSADDAKKLNITSVVLAGERERWYRSSSEYVTNGFKENDTDDSDDNDEDIDRDDYFSEPETGDSMAIPLGVYDDDCIKKLKDCIPLDISRLRKYSIFPGQFVGIEGRNPTKERLCAYKIAHGLNYFPPSPPKLQESLQIVVGAGPFYSSDSDKEFSMLTKLMQYVATTEPNILILTGPFLPEGSWLKLNKNDSYQEMFERLIEKIMGFVESKCTQVVLVASYEDIHGDCMYPTPEYTIPKSMKKSNLHLVPDPCMLDIEGLNIGVTSTDILRHLGSEEMSSKMPSTDRLGRLAEHLLLQQSFYPLYPPSDEVPLDMETFAECGIMYLIPHILLVPSAMRYFCKWSNGTFIMNPAKVGKGIFAKLRITPSIDEQWTENQIASEILRI